MPGRLEICEGKAEFLHADGVSQEATVMFYQQREESDSESTHIVIADGAGFHITKGDERLPSNVKMITLPAYRPELTLSRNCGTSSKTGYATECSLTKNHSAVIIPCQF